MTAEVFPAFPRSQAPFMGGFLLPRNRNIVRPLPPVSFDTTFCHAEQGEEEVI